MIELHTFTDGGQTPPEVARELAAFLAGAQRSLGLALYDVRLTGEAGDLVRKTLLDAHGRGVEVRFVYNVDHPGPIPVPPPPRTAPELLERLPFGTRAVAGIPDLMHHKFVVRDGETVWTGSLNWTDDSWSRQENAVAVVTSPDLARAFTLNFEELWNGADVEHSGRVEPRRVTVGETEVRPWFCPGFGEELAHRIAKQLSKARRRIRIASPVLTSGPILATLAEIAGERRCDVAGVVDDTQCDDVFRQWRLQGVSTWKMPLMRRVLETAQFSGKQSTPWSPESLHDFMHAKIVVADDVTFIGSFNLSRSGERNAENVLELRDPAVAERLATFVDEIRGRYGPATPPA